MRCVLHASAVKWTEGSLVRVSSRMTLTRHKNLQTSSMYKQLRSITNVQLFQSSATRRLRIFQTHAVVVARLTSA